MSNSLGDLTDVHVTTVTVEIYIDKHIAIGIIFMCMFWFYLHQECFVFLLIGSVTWRHCFPVDFGLYSAQTCPRGKNLVVITYSEANIIIKSMIVPFSRGFLMFRASWKGSLQ